LPVLLGNNSYLTELDPTQPNPAYGQPNPWPCLILYQTWPWVGLTMGWVGLGWVEFGQIWILL